MVGRVGAYMLTNMTRKLCFSFLIMKNVVNLIMVSRYSKLIEISLQQHEGIYCYLLDENGFVVAGNDRSVGVHFAMLTNLKSNVKIIMQSLLRVCARFCLCNSATEEFCSLRGLPLMTFLCVAPVFPT